MKKVAVIVNLHSGSHQNKKERLNIEKLKTIFSNYGYDPSFYITKYSHHAKEIVSSLPEHYDLVLSMGGDGTFNEVVTGNLERKKPFLLSHLPYGTTNDIGSMFSLGKNLEKNLILILEGKVRKMDICSINEQPFVYVAGFGRFMNVPYETPRKLKKNFGYLAYLLEGARDFFRNRTHLYDLTYEIDGEKYNGLYSFALISNANRIAGINNFYKDIKLDDRKFEVLFCNIKTKKDILRSLFYLKTNDITKVPGFYFHKTDHLKITFHERLRKPWCFDGEEYEKESTTYEIKIIPNIEMLLPKAVSKELFCHDK